MDINKYKSQDRILVAVDCIIFGFDGKQLQALLIKRGFEPEKGKWSLMGSWVVLPTTMKVPTKPLCEF
jgi:8-oxo-dGTP diphosphatase